MELLEGLLTIAVIHLLAAASPGPDFLLVSQQTLTQGTETDRHGHTSTMLSLVFRCDRVCVVCGFLPRAAYLKIRWSRLRRTGDENDDVM